MGLRSKTKEVVGVDVESGFVAVAEVSRNGSGPVVTRAATGPLRPGLFHEGEVVDVDGLADQLKAFFHEHKLPKRVRLGFASPRMVVRVFELPLLEDDEQLDAAVRFQAQEELPMPLEQAVLEHQVLERFTGNDGPRMRVLVVAVRRDSVEHLLAATRKAGLVPDVVDVSAFALIRALHFNGDGTASGSEETAHEAVSGEATGTAAGEGALAQPSTIYCYVGGLTNLAIATGDTCVFNRVLPNGLESMAAALAERRGLTLDHSRQWLRHVGLERELDHIEGDAEIVEEARQVLIGGIGRIADEVRLSIEYYRSSVPDARPVEDVVMAGPAVAVPGLAGMLETELGLPVEPRTVGKVEFSPGVVDSIDGAQLTIALGLALEEVVT